jgi:hypothetical protein
MDGVTLHNQQFKKHRKLKHHNNRKSNNELVYWLELNHYIFKNHQSQSFKQLNLIQFRNKIVLHQFPLLKFLSKFKCTKCK